MGERRGGGGEVMGGGGEVEEGGGEWRGRRVEGEGKGRGRGRRNKMTKSRNNPDISSVTENTQVMLQAMHK